MAVDFVAAVTKPFTLARLLEAAGDASAELLAGVRPPRLKVVLDRPRIQGRPASSGHEATERELEEVVLGPRPPDPRTKHTIDLVDDRGRDVVLAIESPHPDAWHVIFSPRRDAPGIVWALLLAIGGAREGAGRVLDYDLQLTPPALDDPEELIATTKLAEPASSFEDAASAYLAQFPQLQGWPSAPASG